MLTLRSKNKLHNIVKHSLIAGAFLLIVILGAKIDLDLGGLVSFTLQTLFLGLAYYYLPIRWRFILIVVYLGLGIVGLAVFNGGVGWAYFSSWPMGFFVGFVAMAFVSRPMGNRFLPVLGYFVQIHLVIVLLGVMWLAYFTGSFSKGLETLAELVPGIVIKSLVGAGVVGLVKGFKKA
jgi:biotin transporter BioY